MGVSITGCRLEIWSFQIFFYRQPTRQASTECPLPALKQLNFWMQISSQLRCFPNSNNDHCDLDFRLPVCDVVRRPYRGHSATSQDSMLKRGGGVCGPPMALVWGRRMNQLLVQVVRRRSQAMWSGGGKFSWSVGMVGSCSLGCCGARPFQKGAHFLVAVGRAPFRRVRPYCLLDWQGAQAPIGRFGDFLLLLDATKSWWKIDPLVVIQWLHWGVCSPPKNIFFSVYNILF